MLIRKAAVQLDSEVSLLIRLVKELNYRCTRKLQDGVSLSSEDYCELEKVLQIVTQAHDRLASARSNLEQLIAEVDSGKSRKA